MKKINTLLIILLITAEMMITNLIYADWVQVNNGLNNLAVNALCSYSSGGINYIFAGTRGFTYQDAEIYLSTNNGNSWTSIFTTVNGGDIFEFAATNIGGVNYVYAGTMGYIYRTTNNGVNWLQLPLPNGTHWYYSIEANGNYVFTGLKWWSNDSGGVYRSTDYGLNWIRTSLPTPAYGDYNALTINGNNVYAGGYPGTFVSIDYGVNWLQSYNSYQALTFTVHGNYIFMGLGGGVYISTNNGFNWTQSALNYGTISSLLTYNDIIFAGGAISGGGFYISTNNGSNWLNKSDGLINLVGGIVTSNNNIFVGTGGTGIYRRSMSEIVGIRKVPGNIPQEFKLSQNFPNPFNSSTQIAYELPTTNRVKLNIYDILGQEIASLVDKNQTPGKYTITWDAFNNTSGIYFCKLIAVSENKNESYMNVIKLILNK
ncbi:MAG: T9SS C-terminal target domain-containing protein [Ignavibacteriae bacterium]|nr:MAG: T9SS C-terminal target domain-containing protein [Ignavibacteriota bacterium]